MNKLGLLQPRNAVNEIMRHIDTHDRKLASQIYRSLAAPDPESIRREQWRLSCMLKKRGQRPLSIHS